MRPQPARLLHGAHRASRLAQALSATSHTVYSIQRLATPDRIASARRALAALHDWRAALPPHLGTVRPSSLVPSFRRQATALRLAYHHAVLHATRPFLLLPRPGAQGAAEAAECIEAASRLLAAFDDMAAAGGAVFHAFWWSSYVVFCALTVVYVWEIQRGSPAAAAGDEAGDEGDMARLTDLAERCRGHLARSTAANSPGRRYGIILEELRAEARAQKGWAGHETRADLPPADGRTTGLPGPPDLLDGGGHLLEAGFTSQQDVGGQESTNSLLTGWQTSDWLDLDSSVSRVFMRWFGYIR